jgi:Fe-S cluster assembly ATP-binding protein
VLVDDVLDAAFEAADRDTNGLPQLIIEEAGRIGFDERFLHRALNVDLSGGEKKRNETMQLAVLRPRIAILDELDSGLDVDALRACSRRIEALTNAEVAEPLGVLAITHYDRLLRELRADHIHILVDGRMVESGGPELADLLEGEGYSRFQTSTPTAAVTVEDDPLADPLRGPLA